MAEALLKVKRAFGRDAVILSTRTVAKGGLFGIGKTPVVEITAAPDVEGLPAPVRRTGVRASARGSEPSSSRGTPSARSDRKAGGGLNRSRTVSGRGDRAALPVSLDVVSEIGSLRSMVNELVQDSRRRVVGDLPGDLYEGYVQLVSSEVAEDIAQSVVADIRAKLTPQQLGKTEAVRSELASAVQALLPTSGPIAARAERGPTIVALVGPTGVGKTTTVAKLAANFSLREKRRVGLVTLDTYRIAAVDQLRTYAQIIDVPLEVAVTPDQFEGAVAGLAHCDFIFVDTAGRSQRDEMKMKELQSFFDRVRPHETHLVLSGTCGQRVLDEAIDRFADVGVDRVIFTKLDEAVGFGVVLRCLQKAGAALSYVTTGQDVPDDIEVGEGSRLAERILGDRGQSRAGAPRAEAAAC